MFSVRDSSVHSASKVNVEQRAIDTLNESMATSISLAMGEVLIDRIGVRRLAA